MNLRTIALLLPGTGLFVIGLALLFALAGCRP